MRARSQTRSSKSSPNYRAKLVAVAEAAAAAFWGPSEVYGDVCGDTRTAHGQGCMRNRPSARPVPPVVWSYAVIGRDATQYKTKSSGDTTSGPSCNVKARAHRTVRPLSTGKGWVKQRDGQYIRCTYSTTRCPRPHARGGHSDDR